MTDSEFKDYLAKRTQAKIEELNLKFKKQEDIKQGKILPEDKLKKKKPKLLYSMLPDAIKNMTHGSLNKPKKLTKKAASIVSKVHERIEVEKSAHRTGKSLHDILEKAGTQSKPLFDEMLELQQLIDDPEAALKAMDEESMLAVKAKMLVQNYNKRMGKTLLEFGKKTQ